MSDTPTPVTPGQENTALLSNRTYDILVKLVQVVMPAFATLYFSLASIFGLPNPEGVIAATAALATFFGVLLSISNKTYENSPQKYQGAISVTTSESGAKLFSLDLNGDPSDIEFMDHANFRIVTPKE